jgi:hypothetical protein
MNLCRKLDTLDERILRQIIRKPVADIKKIYDWK